MSFKTLVRKDDTKPKKECPKGKILNPKTNRCVKKNGRIGKRLLREGAGESKSGPSVGVEPAFHDISNTDAFVDIWKKQWKENGHVDPIEASKIVEFINTAESIHPGDIIYVGRGEAFDPYAYRPEYYFYYVVGTEDVKGILATENFHVTDRHNAEYVIEELNEFVQKNRIPEYTYSEDSPVIKNVTKYCKQHFAWH